MWVVRELSRCWAWATRMVNCHELRSGKLWEEQACEGELGVHYDVLSLTSLLVIQVEMLSRQLSLPNLEFSGEAIAGKEHLGVVSWYLKS